MRLTKAAILAIRGSSEIRQRLSSELGISRATIYRWLENNDDNLTKAASIKVIREESGLPDSEIIEEESEQDTVRA